MVVYDEINNLRAVLVKKLNSTMSAMLCAGAAFVLKEKLLTSYLLPESSFI